ncbi:MAG: hypoxanthine phosphoribosyltransferase [Chitinophagaceae bacterium]
MASVSPFVHLHDKCFEPYISVETIAARVAALGKMISEDYAGKKPIFIAVLNGSFVFAADLFRAVTIDAEISFIKLGSYKGMSSSGSVVTAIGLEEKLARRHVILLEDIIDTGKTLNEFLPEIKARNPASLRIASFLVKPEALVHLVLADYTGFEIANEFVVGYGLDYSGLGRNLAGLYRVREEAQAS